MRWKQKKEQKKLYLQHSNMVAMRISLISRPSTNQQVWMIINILFTLGSLPADDIMSV